MRAALVLAGEGAFAPGAERVPWRALAVLVLACGSVHGAAIGSLGWRAEAALYGALKLPVLLAGSTCLCLPSLYVAHALLGVRDDFPATVRGVLCAQGTLAIALVSLAPAVLFAYASGAGYPAALLVNAAVFALAAWAAQRALARHVRRLLERDARHRRVLAAWFVLHAFVSVKLSWILRPFVGDPALPVEFLRARQWAEDPFTNLFWSAAALAAALFRALT